NIDPCLRDRNDDVGKAEAKSLDEHYPLVRIGDHLSYEILTCHSEMHGADRQLAGNFGRGQIGDLDTVEASKGAAIIARTARLDERETGARKKRFGVLLQPSFGRNGEHQRRTHDAPP